MKTAAIDRSERDVLTYNARLPHLLGIGGLSAGAAAGSGYSHVRVAVSTPDAGRTHLLIGKVAPVADVRSYFVDRPPSR